MYFTIVVNGCIKCKNKYTTGDSCEVYDFEGDDKCSNFHPYENACIKCKKNN